MWRCYVLLLAIAARAQGKLDSEDDNTDDTGESGDQDFDDNSAEHIGATVTQITRYPFAASILHNDTYTCSAVILNTFWLVTESKCFNSDIVSSYVTHRNIKNFTVRVGSSYNNKGGTLFKIATLINNFDVKVTALKLTSPMEMNSRVQAARLPGYDDEVLLGHLATIVAWTPIGHMRIVNAPVIEASICDSYTKLVPGYYICIGAVQDVNRHFCRKDNGGAVIQNNTLIGISSYLHTCAVYTRTHAFPKVSTFARWLDSVIWDDSNRPTSPRSPTTAGTLSTSTNTTDYPETQPPVHDPRQYMVTFPYDFINVPLEPSGDNSVIPRLSLYESYLQSIMKSKTSTTLDPNMIEEQKRNGLEVEWAKRYGKRYGNGMMMQPRF